MRQFVIPAVGVLALVMGAAGGCGGIAASGPTGSVPAPAAAVPVAARALTVTHVVDGDTVDLSDGRRVRLLGIDTPEHGDCGYAEATGFARTALLGAAVDVAADPTQDTVDRHGRSLLYVGSPDDYSTAVTRAGWAEHLVVGGVPVRRAAAIESAQQAAMAEGIGIWGATCAPPPPPPPSAAPAPPPPPTTRQAAPPPPADTGVRANATVPRPAAPPPPPPPPAPEPEPEREAEPEPAAQSGCHPSYRPCIPDGADLDCPQIGHRVTVVGPDEYRLNADPEKDDTGCDSYPPA